MSTNIFSRLVPTGRGRSFYDELRTREDPADVEERMGLALDEENLNQHFYDHDLEHAERIGAEAGQAGTRDRRRGGGRSRREPATAWQAVDDDADNDVPGSLLVEQQDAEPTATPSQRRPPPAQPRSTAIPGPSSRRSRTQWESAQRHQRLHHEDSLGAGPLRAAEPRPLLSNAVSRSAREQAMWRWVNVTNLDNFVQGVYDYYRGCGLWCILLDRFLHLVNVAFVAVFLTFLTQCVDYSKIRGSTKLPQILVPQCTRNMSWYWNVGLWVFSFYFIWKSVLYVVDIKRLLRLRDFYAHLLNIPEQDMQTVSWQDVVGRLMALRDANPRTADNMTRAQRKWIGSQSKERLDAHDIANRLMRRENYLIALFNKDILDLSVPVPFMRSKQLLTRTLEWTLVFGILDFVFDAQGQVNQEFLRSDRRSQLSNKLKTRFLFAGFMNLLLAPFVACYLIIVYFLTYYNEFRGNPSKLSARSYTPLAEWKFREFNELEHLFQERLNMSNPFAVRYIEQFPKVKTEQVARTLAFVSGALATVLAIVSLVDSELFLNFEITPDRTVLFYLGIFGSIWATMNGTVSDESLVFDPEYALQSVIEFTHYEPDHWQGRLHSFEVKKEFSELYKTKIVVFLEEILSILVTPLMLFTSLPRSCDQIVDFFREFTIHVDGLGYVCSFAVFDFKKGMDNTRRPGGPEDVREEYYSTKHNKMAASYYGFLDNYVINPRTGLPPHLAPGVRNHFQPPPAFPGLNSPTLAAEMYHSRLGRSERPRSRAPGGGVPPARTPRFGPAPPQPSPMASVLLDPHHQPLAATLDIRNTQRHRPQRGGYHGDNGIIEESLEDGAGEETAAMYADEVDASENGGALDESTWQTSPTKTLSRENSGAQGGGAEVGVLGLMYQFQQAHMNPRGGVR